MVCDFFISRAGENREIATKISVILEDAGYSTYIQDKDFGFAAFTERMHHGFKMVDAGARTIAVLSRVYQNKPYCETEAHYPLIGDPSNTKQRLIVFRIDECNPTGFLKPIPYVDLVPYLSEDEALKEIILRSVKSNTAILSIKAPVEHQRLTADRAEIDRLLQFLQHEDEQDFDKIFNYLFAGLTALAGALIVFEQLINLWNFMFGTNFLAIFDFMTVVFLLFAFSMIFIVVGILYIRKTALVIENSNLRREQLDEFKVLVQAHNWKSKMLIEGVVATASRNILSNKYRP